MRIMNNVPSETPMKAQRWVYWFLFGLMTAGIIYVLVAPRFDLESSSSDKTPLGGVAYDFVQRTVQASKGSPTFVILALAAAFVLGSLHALTPGHNKTLVGSYLVGARGRLPHALLIGMVTAFSHTASALIVGILALSTAGQIASAKYLQWVGLPSGILTVCLGLWLLRRHFLVNDTHEDSHIHNPGHSHDHSHDHEHSHHHLSPDSVTLGGLVALGLMHGIVPTFDAIAIILVALSLQRAVLGAGLILAYSFGIGSVLVVIGVLVVRAQTALLDHPRFERASRYAPAIAAGMVVVLGLYLVLRTLIAL
jgi:nickel/cobalt exporter